MLLANISGVNGNNNNINVQARQKNYVIHSKQRKDAIKNSKCNVYGNKKTDVRVKIRKMIKDNYDNLIY
jgi:hypothetical protein